MPIVRVTRPGMGTEFEVIACGAVASYLEDAAEQALDEVERLEALLSHYRPASDIGDLNARAAIEPVRVDPRLLAILERALAIGEATGGAFDITAGPLLRLWGIYQRQGRWPSPEEIRETLALVGRHNLVIDREAGTIRYRRPGVELNLGAFGKGLAIDAVAETLRELGITAALIHGGTSSVYALGAPPGAEAWAVGIRHPGRPGERLGRVRLRDRALSTSGNYEQSFEVEGRRFGHLIDPRTGYPARGVASVSVAGASAAETDALSTALFVMGVAAAKEFGARRPDLGLVIVPEPADERHAPETITLDIEWEREATAAGEPPAPEVQA
mgnify:CR=1 FL=1